MRGWEELEASNLKRKWSTKRQSEMKRRPPNGSLAPVLMSHRSNAHLKMRLMSRLIKDRTEELLLPGKNSRQSNRKELFFCGSQGKPKQLDWFTVAKLA